MRPEALLHPTPAGLYCPPGDFYIDPVKPVERALITHGHGDHARAGHGHVLATGRTLDIMAIRYGEGFAEAAQTARFGETITINGVAVSFFPAGHVLGSAQIAVEGGGMRIVVSGDYKRLKDPTAEHFELVPCDVFITEATFGLPVFRHPDPASEIRRVLDSLGTNKNRTHLIGCYALGKAQRLIRLLRDNGHDRPIYIHGALKSLCEYYQAQGIDLGKLPAATLEEGAGGRFEGEIVLGPPSAFNSPWVRRFSDPVIAFASGWMQVRQRAKQRGVELPLVISDHCDWPELTQTIRETGAEDIWVTHGREEGLVRWCQLNQIRAKPLNLVGYEDEVEE
ncbi:ligase-associated DNA damage response exonuclease [Salaquimonas pukyongi]|uniref:ligase-associated DNA damage response exonuclease n=1 Tax=Salaquimonas pukyongi TaxID=2712698 RepID=UPI00096B870E|nr:ligase-associated DNA damage response exonuclease [Salaquimonas pukyongi]